MAGYLPLVTTKTSVANAKHNAAEAEATKRTDNKHAARKKVRTAALTHAIKAKEEATTAVQERDAAAARLRDALARTAEERKGAPPISTNIRRLIPIVLDISSGNYTWWREQFVLTIGMYSLQDHVLCDVPALASLDWGRMGCVIRSWLYGTTANDLVDVFMERGQRGATAHATWLAIEIQFSVDALGDVGEQVSDRTLVLNIIRGLNKKFSAIGRDIRRSCPLRTFLKARDDLLLEELTMANPASTSSTALLTSTSLGLSSLHTPSSSHESASRSSNNSGGGKGGNSGSSSSTSSKRKRGKPGGQLRQGSGGKASADHNSNAQVPTPGMTQEAGGPWPSLWNPFTPIPSFGKI
ncbi:uncharacterized protein LOC101783115 [Setaria italica]|uniref:uncharacterized protein LOC101783115 n=1 Tax=Setaria italica TaxID=4555 RepID=UPI000350A9BB|nr:uncharacterized protein LOC101783115 [Setaria italica]